MLLQYILISQYPNMICYGVVSTIKYQSIPGQEGHCYYRQQYTCNTVKTGTSLLVNYVYLYLQYRMGRVQEICSEIINIRHRDNPKVGLSSKDFELYGAPIGWGLQNIDSFLSHKQWVKYRRVSYWVKVQGGRCPRGRMTQGIDDLRGRFHGVRWQVGNYAITNAVIIFMLKS